MSRPSAAPAPLRAVRQRADVADVAPLALEAVECDLDIDEQMRRAAAKINQQFAQLDDAGTLCAMNYVYPLGNFARQLRIVPQASRFVAPAERLQGFALHMAPNAPVFALPFASLPMFNGLLAFPLPPARNLTLNFFANPQNRVLERLAAELSDADDLGAGDTGNFAGFYYDANALQFYVVVQCYSETLARETWQLIVAAEPQSLADVDAAMRASVAAANERRRREHLVDNYEVSIDVAAAKAAAAASAAASVSAASTKPRYTTVDELFLRSTRMQEIARAQREHRLAVALRLCSMFGLSPGDNVRLESPHLIEVTYNCVDVVDRNDPNSDRVLLSLLASANQIGGGGMIYCETPRVFLLRGTWQKERVARRNRELPADAFIGVPVNSGRTQTLAARAVALASRDWRTDDRLRPNDNHTWPDAAANLLFDAANTRRRELDVRFLDVCGRDPASTETPLVPVAVRWLTPPRL